MNVNAINYVIFWRKGVFFKHEIYIFVDQTNSTRGVRARIVKKIVSIYLRKYSENMENQ